MERDEEDLVRLYLTDIGQYPLLTKDDEVRLAQAIEAGIEAQARLDADAPLTPAERAALDQIVAGGEAAFDHFVAANLRLVVSVASKFSRRSQLGLDELIQEGNLGLIRAV